MTCIVFCRWCIHIVYSFSWIVCMWVNFGSWAGRILAAVESCRPGHVLSQWAPLTPVRRNVYSGTLLPGCCKCHWLGGDWGMFRVWVGRCTNRSEKGRGVKLLSPATSRSYLFYKPGYVQFLVCCGVNGIVLTKATCCQTCFSTYLQEEFVCSQLICLRHLLFHNWNQSLLVQQTEM